MEISCFCFSKVFVLIFYELQYNEKRSRIKISFLKLKFKKINRDDPWISIFIEILIYRSIFIEIQVKNPFYWASLMTGYQVIPKNYYSVPGLTFGLWSNFGANGFTTFDARNLYSSFSIFFVKKTK